MAKKKQQNTAEEAKAKTVARIKRTEAYAERVRTLFAATVNEILALNKKMPTLEDGEMFSFDNTSKKMQFEVERLLRQLHSVATMAIQQGIKLEWAQANAECDKLVKSCFGKQVLNTPEFTAWTQRNESAMAAFIARSEKGMNLSQRVWRSCRQLRDEMEVAITCSIGDGTSAATMSRQVRQYLNDPDLMFRRFRYKAGEEAILDDDGNEVGKKIIWGKKWKKKIKKPDGTVGWIDYDKDSYRDQWTGPGYYKSSAQNAMRMTRTETNIAYRRADQARWAQMDFVLGQRVHLSRSHPKKDICDKLAGDYPKDFVFDGWHPQCFCYVTPILIDEDEMAKEQDALLAGTEYKPRGKRITEYPDNFKEWVRENEDRIMSAHDFGTDPYFVRNNFGAVRDILNPKKKLTPLEVAEQRHADRTPEQEEAIRLKWQERQERIAAEKAKIEAERKRIEQINKTAQNVLASLKNNFKGFDIDTDALDIAIQSGDANVIKAETRALAQQMLAQKKQILTTANNVLNVAEQWQEVSSDVLKEVMKKSDVSQIQTETRKLASSVLSMKKREEALLEQIPDVHERHKAFTIDELESAFSAINKTLTRWTIDRNDETSLDKAKKALEYEVFWMGTKGKLRHKTWEISQNAYQRLLDTVNHRIAMLAVKRSIASSVTIINTSRSVIAKQLLAEFDALFMNDYCNLTLLNQKANEIIAKATQLEEARKKREAKKSSSTSTTSSSFTPKSDAETADDFVKYCTSIGISVKKSDVVVENGFVHLQDRQHRNLYDTLKPETDSEHNQLWNHHGAHTRWGAGGYVQTGNSWKINSDFRTTKVVGKLDATAIAALRANGATDDDIKTIKLLDKKISEFSLPVPLKVTRYCKLPALNSIFGMAFASSTVAQFKSEMAKLVGTKAQADPAYLSASTNERQNVFYSQSDFLVKIELEVPPHTPMYFTNNYPESEVVLARSTQYQLLSVDTVIMKDRWGYDMPPKLVLRCRII